MSPLVRALQDAHAWNLARPVSENAPREMLLRHPSGVEILLKPCVYADHLQWKIHARSFEPVPHGSTTPFRPVLDIWKLGRTPDPSNALSMFRNDLDQAYGPKARAQMQQLSTAIWRWILTQMDVPLGVDLDFVRDDTKVCLVSTAPGFSWIPLPPRFKTMQWERRQALSPTILRYDPTNRQIGLTYYRARLAGQASMHERMQLLHAPR